MNWKKTFTYKGKRSVEATVGGNDVKFYPNQLGILQDLASLSQPVAKAINLLVGAEGRDHNTVSKSFTEGEGKNTVVVDETIIEAVSAESKQFRTQQREDGIATIVNMLGDTKNLHIMGMAWMDSMRDEFPRKRGGYDPKSVDEFLYGEEGADDDHTLYQGLEVPQMMEIMSGWMRANAKVFGEVGERLVGYVKNQMASRLQNDSVSTEEPTPNSGDSSKTPSSQLSPSDSPSAS
jgi:hypothetical protein